MTVAQLLADPQCGQLKSYIFRPTGLAYCVDKDEDFATRLLRRMAGFANSGSAYLPVLADPLCGSQEMDRPVSWLRTANSGR
jgi:hypothetical protein